MKKSITGVSLFLATMLSAPVSMAFSVDACQVAIGALKAETDGAEYYGRNAADTEAALIGKLDMAASKVDAAKFDDAVAKIADYRSTVLAAAYAAKPKINAVDAFGPDMMEGGDNLGLEGEAKTLIDATCNVNM